MMVTGDIRGTYDARGPLLETKPKSLAHHSMAWGLCQASPERESRPAGKINFPVATRTPGASGKP